MERRAHGQLKTLVLQVLRNADAPLSARGVLAHWPAGEPVPALTTVLTVLTRLEKAGVLDRRDGGDEARFGIPAATSGAAAESMLSALVGAADRDGALLAFAGHLGEEDLAVLRRALGDGARVTDGSAGR